MERLDAFMARANAAYYARPDPFAGNFTTAPEISQAFGEVLGAFAAVCWQQMGAPAPVLFAEAGPGRGTLMGDALRALGSVAPAFTAAADIHFIETSPSLRELQARTVPHASWHTSLATFPPGPLILLANEFLDALPVRQFVRRGTAWTERYVAAGTFIEVPATPPTHLPDLPDGTVAELSTPARAFAANVAQRVVTAGGVALFLDYGPASPGYGETLQALRDGKPADPLADPGSADLTSHVDFPALATEARTAGAAVFGPAPQGAFLEKLGLFARAQALARGRDPASAVALLRGAQRIAAPEFMGALFKVLAICHPALVPPGFAA